MSFENSGLPHPWFGCFLSRRIFAVCAHVRSSPLCAVRAHEFVRKRPADRRVYGRKSVSFGDRLPPMTRHLRAGLAALAMVLLAQGAAAESVPDLVQRLSSGADFRVRVQAALDLGKRPGEASRRALERALDDGNAAVRAAAAAALKAMKDPACIPALSRHQNDSSSAVRAQIQSSLDALRKADADARAAATPQVMVQLGKFRSHAGASGAVLEDAARTSRQKFGALPGVAVVDASSGAPPARRDVPTVMLTGQVKQLEQSREGSNVTFMASVEFVVHRMPGQTIRGMLSGSARASGAASEMTDAAALEDLRRTAIEAAIESAVRRAPQAFRAALE